MKLITTNHMSSRLPSESKHLYSTLYNYVVDGKPAEDHYLICTIISNPTLHICTGESSTGYKYSRAINMYTADKVSYGRVVATDNPELIRKGVPSINRHVKMECLMKDTSFCREMGIAGDSDEQKREYLENFSEEDINQMWHEISK